MLAYTLGYSPSVEADSIVCNIVESTKSISPAASPPAMTLGSPSVKSELPRSSPAQNSVVRPLPDPGLGIIIQEDFYGHAFRTIPERENTPAFTTSGYASFHEPRKPASPFEGQIRTSAPAWAYPQTVFTDAEQSHFTTPVQQLLSPQAIYPSMQYSVSPLSITPNMQQHLTVPNDMFRHPTSQYNSGINSTPAQMDQWVPQQSMNYYSFPPRIVTQPSTFSISQCQDEWCDQTCSRHQAITVPARRKPHSRPSLSESAVMRVSSPARLRAATTGNFLQPTQYGLQQQLPLPPLPQNVLLNASPNNLLSDSHRHTYGSNRKASNTPDRRRRPSSPPASDFTSTSMPYLNPVRQDPAFEGDLYTPKYKRRSQNGRWEGWCGYCRPGRWLDLKNSRYWEDKLRNHGICAKTKLKFEEPIEIRRVNPDGTLAVKTDPETDLGDSFSDQKKREGLCGTCRTWIAMDGLRIKAKDRAVGWWTHAYKVSDTELAQAVANTCSVTITRNLRRKHLAR